MTSQEAIKMEKIWGQLFAEDGHPTIRLGQLSYRTSGFLSITLSSHC